MSSLFDLGAAGRALEAEIEACDGEIDPLLERFFDQINEEREEKLESYLYLIAEFEARAEMQSRKAAELSQRASANKNQGERLRARLIKAFEMFGWDKIKLPSGVLKLIGNGGVRPIEWKLPDDVAQLPKEFVETVPVVDKDGIRKSLEAGNEWPFARLLERGKRIRLA